VNIPAENILTIKSDTFTALCPQSFFEWHRTVRKLYAIHPKPGTTCLADGKLIAEPIASPAEAKIAVAPYVQGFKHGTESRGALPAANSN
jgi:hypothetical protein